MWDDCGLEPAERVSFYEPSRRETLAVLWLAIFTQGLEAFVLLAGGPLLALLFIIVSGTLAALQFRWLRGQLRSHRAALLLTSIAAAAVPWTTYLLYPATGFAAIGLICGLVAPYALIAVLSPLLASLARSA